MSVISLTPLPTTQPAALLATELSDLNGSILLSLLDATDDGVLLVALDGTIAYANRPALALYGYTSFDQIDGKVWASLWPVDDRERITALLSDGCCGVSANFETRVSLPGNQVRWLRLTLSPVPDARKQPAIFLVTLRDTTEAHLVNARLAQATATLKADLARQDALLRQKTVLSGAVDHRVKNSLALVSGMLRMQERGTSDPVCQNALRDAAARVNTIAEVHDQVSFAEDVFSVSSAPYLSSLMTKVADAHPGLVVLEEGPIAELDLSPDKATALGLVATELLTQALTAAHAGQQVTVGYTFTLEGGACLFSISDDRTELPANFSLEMTDSLSFRICRTHAEQLGGALTHSRGTPSGATFNLAFQP